MGFVIKMELDARDLRKFAFTGELSCGDISIPATISGSFYTNEPNPIRCEVSFNEKDLPPEYRPPYGPSIELKGRYQDKDVWVLNFQPEIMSEGSWEGIAELLIEGDLDEIDLSKCTAICSLAIPPTPLAGKLARHISRSREKKEDITRIEWNTQLGKTRLEYSEVSGVARQLGIHSAKVIINKCQIIIFVDSKSKGNTSLGAILERLDDNLEESLWLLSFLNRQRLNWYQASISTIPVDDNDDPSPTTFKADAHRDPWLGYENRKKELVLVEFNALADGLFQRLLSEYKTSLYKGAIRQTIGLLLSTYERGYFEAKVGVIYSALEGLIHALGADEKGDPPKIIGENLFKELHRKLKKCIKDVLEPHGIEPGVRSKLYENLPGLNRPTTKSQILKQLKDYELDLKNWWPDWADIEAQLKEILDRRNTFIHQGKIDDFRAYRADLIRLQALVELLILKVLGCPNDVLVDHAFHRVRSLGKPNRKD